VDIPTEELSALKQKGVEMVWLMGVWRLGAYGLNFDRTDAGLLAAYRSVLPDFTQADIIGYRHHHLAPPAAARLIIPSPSPPSSLLRCAPSLVVGWCPW